MSRAALQTHDEIRDMAGSGEALSDARRMLMRCLGKARGSHCALFLDVDGTLLDIADTPSGVIVPATLIETLAALHGRLDGALALVSGRSIEILDQLFEPLRLPAAGCHGAQWRGQPGQEPHENSYSFPQSLRERLRTLAATYPDVFVEEKPHGWALHYRKAPEAASALERALRALLDNCEMQALRLLPGKMVFEIVGPLSDKSRAVERFLAVPPFAGRRPVYVGDDVTDEPALALVQRIGGIGMAVGDPRPGAAAVFHDPAEVRRALAALLAP